MCVTAHLLRHAVVTQLGECKTEDLEVAGSSPARGTILSSLSVTLTTRGTGNRRRHSLKRQDAFGVDRRGVGMPIKTFELTSTDAKRFSKLGERFPQLRVDQNTTITSLTAISDADARIDFRFTVNYSGMGMINIEGRIVWEGEAKALADQFSQKKGIPNEVFNQILGAIFTNCLPSAVILARDLQLPPPIPPPPQMQQQGGKATTAHGPKDKQRSMEVA